LEQENKTGVKNISISIGFVKPFIEK